MVTVRYVFGKCPQYGHRSVGWKEVWSLHKNATWKRHDVGLFSLWKVSCLFSTTAFHFLCTQWGITICHNYSTFLLISMSSLCLMKLMTVGLIRYEENNEEGRLGSYVVWGLVVRTVSFAAGWACYATFRRVSENSLWSLP